MNIYRLIRMAAAAQDIIAKYKITDPNLIYFIYSYKDLIPWKDIKSAEDIYAKIKEILYPKIYEKIDKNSPKNNYLKNVDLNIEFRYNMNNLHVQKAHGKYLKNKNEQEAKQIIIDGYNIEKERSFKEWWEYLTTTPKYANNPAVSYCLLRKMIDYAPEKVKHGTLSLNPEVVDFTVNEIIKDPRSQVNIFDVYKKENDKRISGGLEIDPGTNPKDKTGWLLIPSKIHDPQNFPQNVSKLKDLSSPQGWCTGSYNAEPYLSMGDFWLYLINGEAKVTIRMIGDGMGEIRGPFNAVAVEWAERVIDFIYKKGFDKKQNWAYDNHLAELEATCDLINVKFNKGELKPADIDYSQYLRLSTENKAKIGEKDRERIAKEWVALGNIGTATEIPQEFKNYPFVRDAQIKVWKAEIKRYPEAYDGANIPADIKEMPEIKQARLEAWYEKISLNMDLYETAPSDILADPKIHDKIIDYCVAKVEKDPSFYNELPLGVRRGDDRILKILDTIIIPTLADKIVEDPREYENVSYEFVDEPLLKEAFKEGFIELIRRNPMAYGSKVCVSSSSSHAANLEEELKKNPETKAEFKKAWQEGIKARQTKQPLPPRIKKTFRPEEKPIEEPQEKPMENPEEANNVNASLNWYEKSMIRYAKL